MTAKRLQITKTLVSELNIQLADANVRTKLLKVAQSAVIELGNVSVVDATVSPVNAIHLPRIYHALLVQSFDSFALDLYNGGSVISVNCSGLFISYCSYDQVTIKSIGDTITRLSYIAA